MRILVTNRWAQVYSDLVSRGEGEESTGALESLFARS